MLIATDLELRVGPRVLLEPSTFRVAAGDRIGLVGRNGAGKTTMTKVLAGEGMPTGGAVTSSGSIGYLPQDPRTGDLDVIARDRILSARGIDEALEGLRGAEKKMASTDTKTRNKGVRAYARWEERLHVLGGYAAESEAAAIASSLGLPDTVLSQPLHTLSGGQRRRIELARILFSGSDTLLLDEPTNHLDGDSIVWLRDFLKSHQGGLIVISHDVDLVEHVVNKVFYLDANRSVIDVYNMGWRQYLTQREADERRRRRELANAEKQADTLRKQADRFRAKASKARAAQQMLNRADRIMGGVQGVRKVDKVAKLRFPDPAPSGRTPLTAEGLSKSYGSLEIFSGVDLAIDRGSRVVILGLNGAGKTTLLRLLAEVETPDTGRIVPGHGLKLGYYAQEHETLDVDRSVLENMMSAAPDLPEVEARRTLGSFLFTGDDVDKPAGVLSGGEKTRLALATLVVSSANVLLLDEPTNNLDPASREEILAALRNYKGAIVLVTHDEGAVGALQPERVILLPDGVEDVWNAEFEDLIALA
ncbi:ABC transporter [Nocardiopsis sp. CNR-923]|uniref:ABC-F family ATP-binding cassette domain-containing protein n=1 Tax=Nocardiopsis sp. CNR-923 TaxID=1904965 RepID=UPI00095A3DB5|nr:ABC-F family ATP-binding cassette domain-containing protein [Nocardiopsis sp. CNR-923]OLT29968.1 ABC transporter [Nocardiopsis sp. CNR-923]